MAIPSHYLDREKQSFVECPDGSGNPVRATKVCNTDELSSGNILYGIEFDSISATYPTTTSEVYTYTLSASIVATITVTYTDTTKCFITSVVKT